MQCKLCTALVLFASLLAGQTAQYPSALVTREELPIASNFSSAVLSAGLSASATSFSVVTAADAATFPAPGANEAFLVRIDNEMILVCDRTGAVFTVCAGGRGSDDTAAAAHNSGSAVRNVVAAMHFENLAAEVIAIQTALGVNLENVASGLADTDALPEGATNLYFTNTRARGAISVGSNLSYDSGTGVISLPATETAGAGAVPKGLGSGLLDNSWIATGTPDGTKFLRDDRTWATIPSSGLNSTDIDTLSELNAIVTDATLLSLAGGTLTGNLAFAEGVEVDASEIVVYVQKGSAGTITAGQVVALTGYDVGADAAEVELADADDGALMPAFGIAIDTIDQTTSGRVVVAGDAGGLNTFGFSAGDELYASTTAGAFTTTKPTGESTFIQRIGTVQRAHASLGIIEVATAGVATTPSLNSGKIFVGSSSNAAAAVAVSGAATLSDTGVLTLAGDIPAARMSTNVGEALGQATVQHATDTNFVVRAGSTQSSNLQEWPNFGGTVETYVDSLGNLAVRSLYDGRGTRDFDLSTSLGLLLSSGVQVSWANGTSSSGARDVGAGRGGVGVLKCTNGTTGYCTAFDAGDFRVSGAALNFSHLAGTAAISQLATGTPDGTKFIRDDGTLAVPTFSPTESVSVQYAHDDPDQYTFFYVASATTISTGSAFCDASVGTYNVAVYQSTDPFTNAGPADTLIASTSCTTAGVALTITDATIDGGTYVRIVFDTPVSDPVGLFRMGLE